MQDVMKFFIVKAVCGHVGKGKGIFKDFSVKAESAKEAAAIAKSIPRVKHDNKHCIVSVREVDYPEYLLCWENNHYDPFLIATTKSQQKATCNNLDIFDMADIDDSFKVYKKPKVSAKARANHWDCFDDDWQQDYYPVCCFS